MTRIINPHLRDDYISVLIRFHNSAELESLDLAIFSLANQGYRKVEAIICCQSFTEDELSAVNLLVHDTVVPEGFEVKVLNKGFGPGDHRSDLLNMGIEASTGQYLAFLDYDDVLYEGAYLYLVQQLKSTLNALAAFGGVYVNTVNHSGYSYYSEGKSRFLREGHKLQFFSGNLYPIHSGLLDRYRIDSDLIKFDSGVSRNEDYIFFMRILCNGPWCDRRGFFDVGEYMHRGDGSNTVMAGPIYDEEKQVEWRRAYDWVVAERNKLTAQIRVSDFVEFFSNISASHDEAMRRERIAIEAERNAFWQMHIASEQGAIDCAKLFLASRSWRYTRPVRQFFTAFTGKRYVDPPVPVSTDEAIQLIKNISFSASWAISSPIRIFAKLIRGKGG